jgi:hypothetical protein
MSNLMLHARKWVCTCPQVACTVRLCMSRNPVSYLQISVSGSFQAKELDIRYASDSHPKVRA